MRFSPRIKARARPRRGRGRFAGIALAGFAVVTPAGAAAPPELLGAPCETELALSAAPEHLRSGASVYVLTADGYAETRHGTNGFTCIVNRDDPRSLKPTCFDAEGTRVLLPRILSVGRLLMAGIEAPEIARRVAAGFADGTYERPARPGIAYMLSPFNRPWDPEAGRLGWFPPHLMFYAPDLENRDIGFSPEASRTRPWLPFIGYQGPHGFMIVRVPREDGVEEPRVASCPSWVSEGAEHGEPVQASPQHAVPDDIHVFDPYIGRFRSKTMHDEESGRTFHYVAEYAWFDSNRSIVRFAISTVGETDGVETTNGEGFYGYDPFDERLYVIGVFTTGTTGFGSVGEFDRQTHRRVTWARSKGPDGTTIHVRDSFEILDPDTWRDVTSIRRGEDGEWKVVYEDTFTRIEP